MGGASVVALYKKGFERRGPLYRNNVRAKEQEISPNPDGFKANVLFKALEIAMKEDEDGLIDRVRGIYGFKVTNGPGGSVGYWVVNAKTGKGSVEYNGKTKPDVTFTISDTDTVDFISGKLQPQKAFFQGKVKIQGNMAMAMKLPDLQRRAAKKIELIRARL